MEYELDEATVMAKQKQSASKEHESAAGTSGVSQPIFIVGAVLLALALIGSGVLALQGIGGASLPGCGAGSDCAKAANSVWGKIGGIKWLTTANIGLAYFAGLTVAWVASGGTLGTGLRWIVRLSAIASIGLPIVMFVNGYVCKYCLLVHVVNLAFVILLEVRGGALRAERAPVGAFATVAVLAACALTFAQFQREQRLEAAAEGDLQTSTDKIIDASRNDPATTPSNPESPYATEPFTGRYRVGPESAPIRVVIFSDYQCPDCKNIEQEMRGILATRTDISFSHKHFPFCWDCNPYARTTRNLHPNACWAARAAEAAGILGGEDVFWQVHHWLFDNDGRFETTSQLAPAVAGTGIDVNEFARMMQDPRTLALVEKDIEEASMLGLRQTPMIFVNGVELLGWQTPNALTRTINQVAATNPPALTAAADDPPLALEKHVLGWKSQPRRQMPADSVTRHHGADAATAKARVMIWGDYQEPYTRELDGRVRAVVDARNDVSYIFRHYPIDQSCNTSAQRTIHPQACLTAKAAEAAGVLGGNDAYWAMHRWLMDHQDDLAMAALRRAAIISNVNIEALISQMGGPKVNLVSIKNAGDARRIATAPLVAALQTPEVAGEVEAVLRTGAREIGIDGDDLLRTMESTDINTEIMADAIAGKRVYLTGVPLMYVNEKRVPFWALKGEPLPERIIEEAAAGRTEKPQ